MSKDRIAWSQLRDTLRYDEKGGRFFWRHDRNRVRAGSRAGYLKSNGYRQIHIGPYFYPEHRLAWFYMHGKWPSEVDHINGKPADNRIINLRECTRRQNQQNRKKLKPKSSLYKGVCWGNQAKKWMATITVDSKQIHLGSFDSEEEAHEAYCSKGKECFGEFFHPG